MFDLLIGLLVLWVVLAVVGALLGAGFWLVVIGSALFIVTAVAAAVHSLGPTNR
jgi:hypothetical protein